MPSFTSYAWSWWPFVEEKIQEERYAFIVVNELPVDVVIRGQKVGANSTQKLKVTYCELNDLALYYDNLDYGVLFKDTFMELIGLKVPVYGKTIVIRGEGCYNNVLLGKSCGYNWEYPEYDSYLELTLSLKEEVLKEDSK